MGVKINAQTEDSDYLKAVHKYFSFNHEFVTRTHLPINDLYFDKEYQKV